MRKRGISAIVATVLVILVTIVVVGIVWVVIIPMIDEGFVFEELEGRVNVVVGDGYTVYDAGQGVATVQVRRDVDDGVMDQIRILFSIDGDSFSALVDAPDSGGTKTYVFDLGVCGEPDSVKVAPIFSSGGFNKEGSAGSDVELGSGSIGVTGSTINVEGCGFNVPMTGLVGWWDFDGDVLDDTGGNDGVLYGDTRLLMDFDGDVLDDSGYENNGTTTGGVSLESVDCQFGECYDFDGTGYVDLGADSSFDIVDEISVGAWIKREQADVWQRIVAKYYWYSNGTWDTGSWVMQFNSLNQTRCSMEIGGSWVNADSTVTVPLDTWTYVACVYNGTDVVNYVDGNVNSNSASGQIALSGHPVTIGTGSDGVWYQNSFNGKIDEVFVYSRALDSAEIGRIVADGRAGFEEYAPVYSGDGIDFDGVDDYVEVVDTGGNVEVDYFTITAWVKPDSSSSDLNIVSRMNNAYRFRLSSGNGLWGYVDAAGGACAPVPSLSTTADVWQFVAMSYDGTDVDFYLDENSETLSCPNGIVNKPDIPLRMGTYDGVSEYFNGKIDEVMIYNRSLSAEEVGAIYGAQKK